MMRLSGAFSNTQTRRKLETAVRAHADLMERLDLDAPPDHKPLRFRMGVIQGAVLESLRHATEPMTTPELRIAAESRRERLRGQESARTRALPDGR